MKLTKFHTVIKNTPADVREDIKLSMQILDRINELLVEKFDGKQKLLADKLGKSEAEVSKWFNGIQNFTTKTIAKLSVAFGEPIIAICTNHSNSTFEQVRVPYNRQHATLKVDTTGLKEEVSESYEKIDHMGKTNPSVHNILI